MNSKLHSKPTLLTIAIPTYNGSHYIKDALDSIFVNNLYAHSVNVLIVDNGSTDDTFEVISHYQEKYSEHIKIHRNETNIGYDRNIDLIFRLSDGIYTKILADDDALLEPSIKTHLEILKKHSSIGIFLANFDIYDKSLTKVKAQMKLEGEFVNCPLKNPNNFLRGSRNRFGQVSSLTIKTDLWRNIDSSVALGSNYIHFFKLMSILPYTESYIYSKPLIKVREGSPNFEKISSDFILVPLKVIPLLNLFKKKEEYETALIKKEISKQRHYVLRRIVSAKRKGLDNLLHVLILCIKTNYNFVPFWIFYFPLFFIPRFLIRWGSRAKNF